MYTCIICVHISEEECKRELYSIPPGMQKRAMYCMVSFAFLFRYASGNISEEECKRELCSTYVYMYYMCPHIGECTECKYSKYDIIQYESS